MPRDFLTFFPRQDIVTIIGIILNFSASLEKMGEELKYSKQREMVLQAVGRLPGHPNAAEVYEEVKKECASISLATVYRNLNTMADHGLIGKVCLPEGADRFDKESHLHDHMICTCCGDVIDLPPAPWQQTYAEIETNTGFAPEGHRLIVYGLCSECLKAQQKEDAV